MSLISETFQNNKLKKLNINIKTKYIVGNNILERNTDNSVNDDIEKGIRCEKNYYINNKLQHTEKIFDSRIEYTFMINNDKNKECVCRNCGMKAKLEDFIDGCPYCGTSYNIDYSEKDLGSKYHYDRVLRSTSYRVITGVIDIIISLILSFIFIKMTSRTFNSYDVAKIFIYGVILALILYYFFYILDAFIILGPIKRYKDKINQKQIDFWNRTKIDKTTFFNNLNYEIGKKYYLDNNIIDYDILDYLEFKDFNKDGKLCVEVKVDIRLVMYNNGRIYSQYVQEKFVMQRHDNGYTELKNGVNLIKCHNCGASIDIVKGKCDYCGSEIKYLQEWIMVDTF